MSAKAEITNPSVVSDLKEETKKEKQIKMEK